MEKDRDDPSAPKSPQAGITCPRCHISNKNVDCQCPGPPDTTWEVATVRGISMDQLLNGASLLTHTKSNISNVPDSIVRLTPSSDTKTKECSQNKTKLPLSKVSLRNECLYYDKEAVNVGSSSRVGSELNIFEIDFDCVDSTMVIKNESSHKVEGKQLILERTPVKEPKRAAVPNAPQKNAPKTTDGHREYSARTSRHACPYCSKTFRSNGKLNNHVFTHTGERPFACKHCHKAFSSKFKLVRHLLIHSEERKFLCTVCERRFLRNDHLKNHYKVHDPRKVLFRCTRVGCEKEYSSAMSQRKHEAWHRAQDGDLTCLLCRVKHETVADLLIHLRRHSGSRLLKSPADRKFRCHVCERHFLTRKDVTRHLVVHTGERDFLCQFCPQRFGRKDHLIRHIKKSHHSTNKKKIRHSKPEDKEGGPAESDTAAEGAEEEDEDDPEEEEEEEETEPGADGEETSVNLSEPDLTILDDDDMLEKAELHDIDDMGGGDSGDKVPRDLEEIPTSQLIMPDTSPCSLTDLSGLTDSTAVVPLPAGLPSISTERLIPQPSLGLLFQTADVNFESVNRITPCDMLSTATDEDDHKKEGDMFEGPSQSLMFGEPTFDEEEYKSSDFLISQGESSGELLRFLLQSDPAAPLPGFSQAFNNNSCPPKS